jgi:hypothetical protein
MLPYDKTAALWNNLLYKRVPSTVERKPVHKYTKIVCNARNICQQTPDNMHVWMQTMNTAKSTVGVIFLTETHQRVGHALPPLAGYDTVFDKPRTLYGDVPSASGGAWQRLVRESKDLAMDLEMTEMCGAKPTGVAVPHL